MINDGQRCKGLCAELFALYRYNFWRLSATPAGYAATYNQAQRDPVLRLPVYWVVKRREVSVLDILKNDLSGYLWLVPCRTADAAATVDALMRRFAVFGVVLLWISDRGSHFKNEVIQRVQKELKAKHSFTTANFL
jgi:hypothetical protein